MADMNDIAELLGSLLSGGENGSDSDNADVAGDIDPEMLLKILDIVSGINGNDANTALLTALRPLLKAENRPKLDRAASLMKLMRIIPLLRDAGLLS